MLTTILALLVLAGWAMVLMTPEERMRALRRAIALATRASHHLRHGSSQDDPLSAMLRARTGRPVVTPLLLALNALVFAGMLVGAGSLDDMQTLVAWGANHAPRTTNGEWWRLVTAMFVHTGFFHLAATSAGLAPLGVVLERAVGRFPFAAIYLASGVLANVIGLWTTSPLAAGAGPSAAVFGIYGLALATVTWGLVSGPAVPVPPATLKRIGAGAAVFFLYNVASGSLGMASEVAGLGTGLGAGLVLARGVMREKPAPRRAAAVMAATALVALAAAVPLRGIVDVRPQLAAIAEVEVLTTGAYDEAVVEFRRRRITAEDLARVIHETIVPELQAARGRLSALRGVPPEQAPLVAAAEEYFALRETSWLRRAEGLLGSDTTILRRAEETERAAIDALRRAVPLSAS
jgi:rhomboid protease GluP